MISEKLENCMKQLVHAMAEMNQQIFVSGDYADFLSLCNNDISILVLLLEYPGETAKQISGRLKLPKTTVVTAVARLVKRGFLTREKNPRDGREQFLLLSELGKKAVTQHKKYEKEFMDQFIHLFQEEDYETLAEILERSKICSITK